VCVCVEGMRRSVCSGGEEEWRHAKSSS